MSDHKALISPLESHFQEGKSVATMPQMTKRLNSKKSLCLPTASILLLRNRTPTPYGKPWGGGEIGWCSAGKTEVCIWAPVQHPGAGSRHHLQSGLPVSKSHFNYVRYEAVCFGTQVDANLNTFTEVRLIQCCIRTGPSPFTLWSKDF